MEDRWFTRDLRVLDAIVSYFDENVNDPFVDVADLAPLAGMEPIDVYRAVLALDGRFIEWSPLMGPDYAGHVIGVHPEARVAVGAWPSGETMTAQLIEAIEQAADREPDPEKKTRLRALADGLGGAARDITVSVLTKMIEHQTGMS